MDTRRIRRGLVAALGALVVILSVLVAPSAANAHASGSYVKVYPPIVGSSTWDRFGLSHPSKHHIVFSNWGYKNDWSVDIYRNPGATVVTPFGSTTSNGHAVTQKVVSVSAGCATGNLADGGWRIVVEARDAVTGDILARGDIMHVDKKPASIVAGTTIGPWTSLGTTGRFRYSSCYQVNGDSGAHIHLEVINQHRYSCYMARSSGTAMTDLTVIGRGGSHGTGQRQAC